MTKKVFLITTVSVLFIVGSMFTAYIIINYVLPQEIVSSYSWIKMGMKDLVKESDIIVIGTVEKVLPSVEEKIKIIAEEDVEEARKRGETNFTIVKDREMAEKERKDGEINRRIYTDKIVKVDEHIFNPQNKETIIVREDGGRIGNQIWRDADSESLRVGNELLMFLKEYKGAYYPFGGPQSKYFIKGNEVVNGFGEDRQKLDELITQIKSLR